LLEFANQASHGLSPESNVTPAGDTIQSPFRCPHLFVQHASDPSNRQARA
jgi:hypothetical protein